MTKRWMATAGALVLAGCAAEPAANPTALAAAPAASAVAQQNCSRVYRVGSNIPVVECREQSEEETQRLQSELRRLIRPNGKQSGGGG